MHRTIASTLSGLLACALAGALQAEDSAVDRATRLQADGKPGEAMALLEPWLAAHPDDAKAQQLQLAIRIALLETEIRILLNQQVEARNLIVGSPDYEAAKARSSKEVAIKLDIVEYHLVREDYPRAIDACHAILRDHPNEQATLSLKYRILSRMVDRERRQLEMEEGWRHGKGINDVIEKGLFPREKDTLPRTIWIFDEDLAEAERQRVKARLQEGITMMHEGRPVGEILRLLFATAGINFIILDSAIGEEKITLHLIDEKVETVLAIVAKMAKIRYNYSNGTVFIVGDDADVMETQIIRLRSGLTDVDGQVPLAPLDGSSNAGSGANGGGGGGTTQPSPAVQVQNLLGGGNAADPNGANGKKGSDLERFLEKVPEIIVGWPSEGKLYLERKSNTLYVRSTPWAISELKRLLQAIDYNNVQVLIEARFVEVGEGSLRQLGVQWGVSQGGVNGNAATIKGGFVPGAATAIPTSGLVASLLTAKDALGLDARLAALQEDNKADTLAEPKILTINNTLGQIDLRRDVPYVDNYESRQQSSQQVVTGTNTTTNVSTTVLVPHFATANEGFQLKIKPSIARNSQIITLNIQPTVREVVLDSNSSREFSYNSGAANAEPLTGIVQSPAFKTRTLSTQLHVSNGETVVMGGLITQTETFKQSGVPVLQDVPLVGGLFRSRITTNDRKHLLILVKATIIDPTGAKLGDEIRTLRDTVQVTLPADARQHIEDRERQPEAAAPAAPAESTPAAATKQPAGRGDGVKLKTGTGK